MKKWANTLSICAMLCAPLGYMVGTRTATAQGVDAAVQALQQAPDPSAAVAAYANGVATDRNNPKLVDAYVTRMVDLGLPEMAFHQAEALATWQPNNGLAWGVVAYVSARRAQMPEAIAAINLAGQFAPDNKFVQHTAGELVAWYDLKADKSQIPENSKSGLVRVRSLLDKRPDFIEAYSTAQKAYEAQATPAAQNAQAQLPPAPAVPTQAAANQAPVAPVMPDAAPAPMAPQAQVDQIAPLGYTAPAPPPVYYQNYYPTPAYYPDYSSVYLDWGPAFCYDWGPGWVAPTPWCWWQPCGFWSGCSFFPFGVSFAFGDFDDFHHFHDGFHGHDGRFGHDGHFGHDGAFAGGHDAGSWHRDAQGRNEFFGRPARPSAAATQWARTGSRGTAPVTTAANTGSGWWRGAAQRSSFAAAGGSVRNTQRSGFASTRANQSVAPRTSYASSIGSQNYGRTATPAQSWAGTSSGYRSSAATPRTWAGQYYGNRSSTGPSTAPPAARAYSGYPGAVAPRSSWAAPGYSARSYAYAAPRYSMPSARSYGGWRSAAPSSSSRSFGGGFGGFRSGSSFGGGFRSGGSFGGGYHSSGFGGGFHGGSGGGFHGGGFGGGGGHGGGHR